MKLENFNHKKTHIISIFYYYGSYDARYLKWNENHAKLWEEVRETIPQSFLLSIDETTEVDDERKKVTIICTYQPLED